MHFSEAAGIALAHHGHGGDGNHVIAGGLHAVGQSEDEVVPEDVGHEEKTYFILVEPLALRLPTMATGLMVTML